MYDDRIKKLLEQIQEIKDWIAQNSIQQIRFPLGIDSMQIAQENLLVWTKDTITPPTFNVMFEVEYNGALYWIKAKEI